jgi:hypothetical protein
VEIEDWVEIGHATNAPRLTGASQPPDPPAERGAAAVTAHKGAANA